MIFTHQNLIYNWLTYLVHAKSTGELISFGFSDRSVRSLVSAKRSANRSVQTKKRLHFLADLWSQSQFRTQRNAERKTNPKKWNDPLYWEIGDKSRSWNQGLKYLKMSTTHREGRWRGRKPRARHGGAKRRSAEGVGSGEGRRSPSLVWGSGGIAPRKFWNLTVQICSFFHDFKTEIALPSVVFHSFTAYICSYYLRQKSPLHFATSHSTLQQS